MTIVLRGPCSFAFPFFAVKTQCLAQVSDDGVLLLDEDGLLVRSICVRGAELTENPLLKSNSEQQGIIIRIKASNPDLFADETYGFDVQTGPEIARWVRALTSVGARWVESPREQD